MESEAESPADKRPLPHRFLLSGLIFAAMIVAVANSYFIFVAAYFASNSEVILFVAMIAAITTAPCYLLITRILSYRFRAFQFSPLIAASVCGSFLPMILVSIKLEMITLLAIWMSGVLGHLLGTSAGNQPE